MQMKFARLKMTKEASEKDQSPVWIFFSQKAECTLVCQLCCMVQICINFLSSISDSLYSMEHNLQRLCFNIFWGIFSFCLYNIQHCFICRPSDSTVPTDAGIEPRTVATSALAVRRSNHQARLICFTFQVTGCTAGT